MDELKRLFDAHEKDAWPESLERGSKFEGVEVVMLDADAVGIVHSFLGCSHRLDVHQTKILREIKRELKLLVPKLDSGSRPYFARLERMTDLILREFL